MSNRVKRTRQELREALSEQVDFLETYCKFFDEGKIRYAKAISGVLRILLHSNEKSGSRSLLDQLQLRNKRFFDTSDEYSESNLLTTTGLLVMSMKINQQGQAIGSYIPKVQGEHPDSKWINFSQWWKNTVLKDKHGNLFCRNKLIINVANTDGGTHVDASIREEYKNLSQQNSLGFFTMSTGDLTAKDFEEKPELACMRQIAHEVLCTLKKHANWLTITYLSAIPVDK